LPALTDGLRRDRIASRSGAPRLLANTDAITAESCNLRKELQSHFAKQQAATSRCPKWVRPAKVRSQRRCNICGLLPKYRSQ
jgi:hypothetical protein